MSVIFDPVLKRLRKRDTSANFHFVAGYIYITDNDFDITKAGTVRIGRDIENNKYGQWLLKTDGTWQPIQEISTNV